MNLHEYQGKQLFAEYGLPVSQGIACDTPEEAVAAALDTIALTTLPAPKSSTVANAFA